MYTVEVNFRWKLNPKQKTRDKPILLFKRLERSVNYCKSCFHWVWIYTNQPRDWTHNYYAAKFMNQCFNLLNTIAVNWLIITNFIITTKISLNVNNGNSQKFRQKFDVNIKETVFLHFWNFLRTLQCSMFSLSDLISLWLFYLNFDVIFL